MKHIGTKMLAESILQFLNTYAGFVQNVDFCPFCPFLFILKLYLHCWYLELVIIKNLLKPLSVGAQEAGDVNIRIYAKDE